MSAKPEQHLKVGDWWYLPQQDKLVKIDDTGEISETASLDNLCQKALNYFLVNAGRLVTRDELLSDVWGVRDVSDGRISRVIRVLRVALGDDSREPRYIETIPKRGFRFIAPVAEVILTSGNDEPVDNHIEEQHAIQQQERKHHRHWWLLAGTFLSCVLAISGWQYWQQSQLDPQV
ncbi:MAG: transcriptional regulator, partial [Chromatiaceae bacterium]